jgi:hypothetical protein
MAADALFRLGRSLLIRAELTGVARRAPIDLTEVVAGAINAEWACRPWPENFVDIMWQCGLARWGRLSDSRSGTDMGQMLWGDAYGARAQSRQCGRC